MSVNNSGNQTTVMAFNLKTKLSIENNKVIIFFERFLVGLALNDPKLSHSTLSDTT